MDIRIECHSVHVVPGISGSYCDNCTGRETEVRGGDVACAIASVSGKSPSWILSLRRPPCQYCWRQQMKIEELELHRPAF